jgi:hypothetical protein
LVVTFSGKAVDGMPPSHRINSKPQLFAEGAQRLAVRIDVIQDTLGQVQKFITKHPGLLLSNPIHQPSRQTFGRAETYLRWQ